MSTTKMPRKDRQEQRGEPGWQYVVAIFGIALICGGIAFAMLR